MANSKSKLRENFVREHTDKHVCACGCGGYIRIARRHNSMGIPKFIHGHNSKTEESKKFNSKWHSKRIGPLHPHWIKDRSKVKGPRRWVYNFTKRQKRDIYVRDNGVCQNCGIICLLDVAIDHPWRVNIHHIIPIEYGGENEIHNGQVLCLSCHKLLHSAIAKTANSEKPLLNSEVTPSQTLERDVCVETNVQSPKGMI